MHAEHIHLKHVSSQIMIPIFFFLRWNEYTNSHTWRMSQITLVYFSLEENTLIQAICTETMLRSGNESVSYQVLTNAGNFASSQT